MKRVLSAAVAVALSSVVAACGGGGSHASTATTTTTTTVASETTLSTATTGAPVTVESKESKCATAPKKDAAPAPSDWANYWQTQPDANQPLTLEACLDDITPKVGQLVTLTVTADDPDASIGQGACDIYVGWATTPGSGCRTTSAAPSSPVPTPAKVHGHVVKSFTYRYTKAQTYLVFVHVWSSPDTATPNPYGSEATTSIHVTVSV